MVISRGFAADRSSFSNGLRALYELTLNISLRNDRTIERANEEEEKIIILILGEKSLYTTSSDFEFFISGRGYLEKIVEFLTRVLKAGIRVIVGLVSKRSDHLYPVERELVGNINSCTQATHDQDKTKT